MRVGINALSIPPGYKNGAEAVLLNLLKGFYKTGHSKEIIIFCYQDLGKEIHKLSNDYEVVIVKDKGFGKHVRIGASIVQSLYFHKIYRKYNLDVVFFANAEIGVFKYNIPVVVIPHDIQNVSRPIMNKNRIMYLINYLLYWISFKVADKIIAISEVDRNEIVEHYPFTQSKIEKIYNPIDIDEKNLSIIQEKSANILAVNIQHAHKNIETLIKAFSVINNKRPELKLLLVGAKSDYVKSLEAYVKAEGLTENVIFMGFVSKDRLEDIWRKAKLYVNPSLYEGFGMTSVESIMYGAPTLLGNLPVNKEVTQGLCEYYDELTNEFELAHKMEEMLDETYDLDTYLSKAQSLINIYKLETICTSYWKLFEKVSK